MKPRRFHSLRTSERARRAAGCALLLMLAGACAETPRETPVPVTIRLATSSTLGPSLDALGDAYRAERPWVTIEQESLDSAAALEALHDDEADLAFVSWLEDGDAAWTSALARDAVAVIVHPSNPVDGLSLAQLRDAYQGRLNDWSPFGWEGQSVVVVSREDGSGTRAAFEQAVMAGRSVTLNAVVQPTGQAVLDYVARTPGAIGYVSRALVTDAVKAVAVEGVRPDPADAAYPIGRALYVLAQREPQGGLRDFVAWLLGEEGQRALAERGFGRVR